LLLWIKELTGSAAVMGLVLLMSNLPEVLLAPFGGTIADRFGKARTMVVADLVSAVAVGLVCITIWLGLRPSLIILALCASNVVLGIAASCFNPAVSALVPALVPRGKLERGNAQHQFSRVGGRVIGQGSGGFLFATLGAMGAFVANALSFMVSAVSEMFIRSPKDLPVEARPGRTLLRETGETLRRVWRERGLRSLVVYIAVFHLCLSCLPVLLPFFAEHALRIPDKWFGVFIAAYTAGILLGFTVSGALRPPGSRFRFIAAVSGGVGLLFGGVAATSLPAVAWVLLLGIGIGIGLIIVNLMTELQLRSRDHERGAIMGVAHGVGGSSFPIGMALTGLALDGMHRLEIPYTVSSRAILAVSAMAALLVAATALFRNGRPDDHNTKTG
jgi:MFS family permease